MGALTSPARLAVLDQPFSPKRVPGLLLDLDPDLIAGVADGAAVTTIPDGSGLGSRDAGQATAAKKGLLRVGLYDGHNAVDLDGVDDCYQVASIALPTFFTLFVVGKFTTTKPLLVEHGADVNSNDGFAFYGDTNTFWNVRRASLHNAIGPNDWMTANLAVAELVYDGSGEMRLNGTIQANGTISGTARADSDVTAALNIGSRNQASVFGDGDLCRLLIYRGAKSAYDRGRIRAWLGARFGVAVT